MKALFIAGLLLISLSNSWADTTPENDSQNTGMDNQRLQQLIKRIAGEYQGRPGFWQFEIEGYNTSVITDEQADRMRILVPVADIEGIDEEDLQRIMQANFDSALDARYSIAKGILWSAFIHPLAVLTDHQFIDGLAQTVNLAATYGTTYSSGALVFKGGDSRSKQNKYYQDIIERENSI